MDGNGLNLIVAIILCAILVLSWQYFIALPRMGAEHQAHNTFARGITSAAAPALLRSARSSMSKPSATNDARVHIESANIDGSIRLKGAHFDDLRLKQFHTSVDPKSPEVALFDSRNGPNPHFADFGWLSANPSESVVPDDASQWNLVSGTKLTPHRPIILEWENGHGLVFRRRIEMDRNYMFTIIDSVQNNSRRSLILSPYAYVACDGVSKAETSNFVHIGFVGVADGSLKNAKFKDVAEKAITIHASTGWVGTTDHYWMAAIIPPQGQAFDAAYRASTAASGTNIYQAEYRLDGRPLVPGATIRVAHRLFAGAKIDDVLEFYQEKQNVPRFDLAIDWGWFRFITKPMFVLLEHFNRLLGNFGLAILLLTVVMKLAFLPLANLSFVSSLRMKRIQPQMKEIQERLADDKMRQQQEIAALYKRERVKPLATGCLPTVIQLPVFLSLLSVLYAAIEMYHAPFYGWIYDLSAPDPTSILNLFGLLPYHVPSFVPVFLSVGIWPILMGVAQWLQIAVTATAVDPMQARISAFMPVVLTFVYAGLPAGLVIYYAWNTLLTIGQQFLLQRIHRRPAPILLP